jgi:hypothetical protein
MLGITKKNTIELHLSKCFDPLTEFVANSTELTCLEITGCRIKYNTVLQLLELIWQNRSKCRSCVELCLNEMLDNEIEVLLHLQVVSVV